MWALPQRLNLKVREYYEDSKKKADGGPWLDRPEIPSSGEVLVLDNDGSSSSESAKPLKNRKAGAWESKGELSECLLSASS